MGAVVLNNSPVLGCTKINDYRYYTLSLYMVIFNALKCFICHEGASIRLIYTAWRYHNSQLWEYAALRPIYQLQCHQIKSTYLPCDCIIYVLVYSYLLLRISYYGYKCLLYPTSSEDDYLRRSGLETYSRIFALHIILTC